MSHQPQRPGELCTEIRLTAPWVVSIVEQRSAASRLPQVLWATLAVESRRVLELASDLFDMPTALVVQSLDATSSTARAGREVPGSAAGSRLTDYAAALMRPGPGHATPAIGQILLRTSTTMLTAWKLACEQDGKELAAWAAQQLVDPPRELVRWEASAATAGQTLAEWAVVQAARRLRSASTVAQTAE